MSTKAAPGNTGIWAPITNVALGDALLAIAVDRAPGLPGIVVFSAPSGFGKSFMAMYLANRRHAVYVEVRSFFTRKTLLQAILKELGIVPARTMQEMFDQAANQLFLSKRPLLIDEADRLVNGSSGAMIELVRDLYEASKVATMLIGEEKLPQKLAAHERVHNRVLRWEQGQPATADDVRKLAAHYVRGVELADDLQAHIAQASHFNVRRIAVNLEFVRDLAAKDGKTKVDRAMWGTRPLYTGDAPAQRY